jgi:putative transposase
MYRTYTYPLRVSRQSEAILLAWLEHCRQLYNGALEHRVGAWGRARASISYPMQTAELTQLRAEDPRFAEIPVAVLRSALRRLDRAFQSFFRRAKEGEKPLSRCTP